MEKILVGKEQVSICWKCTNKQIIDTRLGVTHKMITRIETRNEMLATSTVLGLLLSELEPSLVVDSFGVDSWVAIRDRLPEAAAEEVVPVSSFRTLMAMMIDSTVMPLACLVRSSARYR